MRIGFGNMVFAADDNDNRYNNKYAKRARAITSIPGSIGTIIVAVVFITLSFLVRSMSQIDSSWKRVTARVTSVEKNNRNECSDDNDGNQTCRTVTYYKPTLAYTVNGRTVTVDGDESESINVGDSVDIAYEPGNETNIKEVSSAKSGNTMSWVLFGAGVLMIVLGVVNIIRGVKAGKEMVSDVSKLVKPAEGNGILSTSQLKNQANNLENAVNQIMNPASSVSAPTTAANPLRPIITTQNEALNNLNNRIVGNNNVNNAGSINNNSGNGGPSPVSGGGNDLFNNNQFPHSS